MLFFFKYFINIDSTISLTMLLVFCFFKGGALTNPKSAYKTSTNLQLSLQHHKPLPSPWQSVMLEVSQGGMIGLTPNLCTPRKDWFSVRVFKQSHVSRLTSSNYPFFFLIKSFPSSGRFYSSLA